MPDAVLVAEDAKRWTCTRCDMTVQWMDGHEGAVDLPDNWVREGEDLHCLACRRDNAAETAQVPEDTPPGERVKIRSRARLEFELRRAPDKPDGQIAKSCQTSAAAVKKARDRLGIARPVN